MGAVANSHIFITTDVHISKINTPEITSSDVFTYKQYLSLMMTTKIECLQNEVSLYAAIAQKILLFISKHIKRLARQSSQNPLPQHTIISPRLYSLQMEF